MITVVGGAYWERCRDPSDLSFYGSGVRAAAMLAANGAEVELVTVCGPDDRAELDSITTTLDIALRTVATRPESLTWKYDTPVSAPRLLGAVGEPAKLDVQCDRALVFGLMESVPHVKAERILLDPQNPTAATHLPGPDVLETCEIGLVANFEELRRMSGVNDPRDAAKRVLDSDERVVVVFAKLGAIGAMAVTRDERILIEPIPTDTVWPIGSGDAFAAGIANAWLKDGLDVGAAVGHGMSFAASWCSTRDPAARVKLKPPVTREFPVESRCVYLAGPFFDLSQRWLINTARAGLGAIPSLLEVFSPFHDVGLGGEEVAIADIAGLTRSTAVFALVDGDDPGTVFEIGWARSKDIAVVAYGELINPEGYKILRGTGCEIHTDLTTALYRAAWHAFGYLK